MKLGQKAVNAKCSNTLGGFTCKCNTGYRGNGKSCVDVDECSDGSHSCDVNATCLNGDGSYTCACNEGYTGDGFMCTDADIEF